MRNADDVAKLEATTGSNVIYVIDGIILDVKTSQPHWRTWKIRSGCAVFVISRVGCLMPRGSEIKESVNRGTEAHHGLYSVNRGTEAHHGLYSVNRGSSRSLLCQQRLITVSTLSTEAYRGLYSVNRGTKAHHGLYSVNRGTKAHHGLYSVNRGTKAHHGLYSVNRGSKAHHGLYSVNRGTEAHHRLYSVNRGTEAHHGLYSKVSFSFSLMLRLKIH
ncbi:hypothetical protein ACOMHN_009846 [Nucella lapillus]